MAFPNLVFVGATLISAHKTRRFKGKNISPSVRQPINASGSRLETIEQAAIRELQEECGLKAKHIHKRGVIEYEFERDPKILVNHFFETHDFTGTVSESEEMKPEWFDIDSLPLDRMWVDEKLWLPTILNDRNASVEGKFLCRGLDIILQYNLKFS